MMPSHPHLSFSLGLEFALITHLLWDTSIAADSESHIDDPEYNLSNQYAMSYMNAICIFLPHLSVWTSVGSKYNTKKIERL